jgi:hypothetical protein
MPSFKERFRTSRKYKKNKESGGATSLDEATAASGIFTTTTTTTTIDEPTGSRLLSTHYSVDYCK